MTPPRRTPGAAARRRFGPARAGAVLLAALALGACGGGGRARPDGAATAPPTGATAPAGTTAPPPTAAPPASTAPPTATAPAPPPRNTAGARAGLLVIGDSLSVATAPILPGLLPGWRVYTDGLGGRPLAAGMATLGNTQLPKDGSIVVGFSLFTNDDPAHPEILRDAVRTSLHRVGPRGCVIWATIVRPPLNGHSYDAANALLRTLARAEPRRMRLVDWAVATGRNPALLGPDGIHPTAQGAQARARMYADAAQSCGPAESSEG